MLAQPPDGRISPMTDVVIAAATRTPIGSFNGLLATVPAQADAELSAEFVTAESATASSGGIS